jgi:hypothetical protein
MSVNLDSRLPVLNRIVRAPVFALDGELITGHGYHPASGTFYDEPSELLGLSVSPEPTLHDLERARKLVLEELLGDFPFASPSDQAHAVALMVLPFVRPLIDGPTPLHLIEASKPGTGKGLLAEIISIVCQSSPPELSPLADEESEIRKSITSALITQPQFIMYDEVNDLGSRQLALALTAQRWRDRILGSSSISDLPVEVAWIALGNNVTLSSDFLRRTIRCRLIAPVEKPWERSSFRHPNLTKWAKENRRDLVWACLTLISYGMRQQKPEAQKTLGSYERWADLMGRILAGCGIFGFLQNQSESIDTAGNAHLHIWRAIVSLWWDVFKDQAVKASELFEQIIQQGEVDLELRGRTDQALITEFGIKLRQQRDAIFAGYQIKHAGTGGRANLWRLLPVKIQGEPGEPDEPSEAPPTPENQTAKNGRSPHSGSAVCYLPQEESQGIRGSPGSPPSPEQISIVFHNGAWRVCSSETGYPLSQSLHKSREAAETEAQLLVTRGAAWD